MDLWDSRLQAVERMLKKVEKSHHEILELLREKTSRKEYMQKYYQQKKLQRSGLKNPDRNNLNLPRGWDIRLKDKMQEWAEVAFRFATVLPRPRPFDFLEWLCWTWNVGTYQHKVITKSGGYNHLFIGYSGDKPLRLKFTDGDLYGNVRRTTFTPVQRDQFCEALWWKWGFAVLVKLKQTMGENRFQSLAPAFKRPLLLLMGGFGEVEVQKDLFFDPHEANCSRLGKAYRHAKPDLDRAWNACKKGLFSKVEPHADFLKPTC